eukprot:6186734-Pleurochrysis_carterae.AAC.3
MASAKKALTAHYFKHPPWNGILIFTHCVWRRLSSSTKSSVLQMAHAFSLAKLVLSLGPKKLSRLGECHDGPPQIPGLDAANRLSKPRRRSIRGFGRPNPGPDILTGAISRPGVAVVARSLTDCKRRQ